MNDNQRQFLHCRSNHRLLPLFLTWVVYHCLLGNLVSSSSEVNRNKKWHHSVTRAIRLDGGNIPRSRVRDYSDEEQEEYLERYFWSPSSNIDGDGFFHDLYECCVGDWEEEVGIRGRYSLKSKHSQTLSSTPVQVRQVPGDGNCLFHSLAATLSMAETNSHLNFTSVRGRKQCHKLRQRAIQTLEKNQNKKLFLQGTDSLRACDLVQYAASQYKLTNEEYCAYMKRDGYWGGGPEIVALSNALRRPIHVYELSTKQYYINKPNDSKWWLCFHNKPIKVFLFRRLACFGSPKFDSKEPLHILSADSRFPDIAPGQQLSSGNHFLALFFPSRRQTRRKQKKPRNQIIIKRQLQHSSEKWSKKNHKNTSRNKHTKDNNGASKSKKKCKKIRPFLEIVQQWIQSSPSRIQQSLTTSYQRSLGAFLTKS